MRTTTTTPAGGTGAPPAVGRGPGALVGAVAVAAALGAGHLVAGIVSPASSPYLAVGDAAVRLAPEWLVEFAKSAFGTADKPVLLAGMAVVLAAVAAAAGIASRHSPRPGVTVLAVLGALGLLAVAAAPTFALLDVLAPAASTAAGIAAFRMLHRLAAALPEPPLRARGGEPVSRRGVLAGTTAAVGAGALGAAGIGHLIGGDAAGSRDTVAGALGRVRIAEPAPPVPAGADFAELGTPTFHTPNAEFYRIDTALRVPNLTAADWSLRVHGMVDRELRLSFADLLARPLVERPVTLLCVSNEVGGPYISTADFLGVDLRSVLQEAGVRPGADQLLSTSADGWTAGTPVDVLLEPDRGALLAVGMNGEALPPEHGFPVRIVVPGLYGFVSATKWVVDLELTTFAAKQAYWLRRGWAQRAPIKTQSRIDVPRAGAGVPAGRATVAGIAWAQPHGISRVEVRVDGGPWRDAELSTEVSGDTWRMWRAVVDVAPGSHTAQVRATDARGETQTERQAPPVPDGATGWHSIVFSAR